MIRLLSTDFDGTLVNHFARPPVVPALFELLRNLQDHGVLWAINTGRTLSHIVEGMREFGFPVEPDFVLTTEREVFRRAGGGWEDFGDWNRRCFDAHEELFAVAAPLLEKIVFFVDAETNAEVIFEDSRPVGLVGKSDAEMNRILAFIDAERTHLPVFGYQQNTVYLRFCHRDYSKGSALGELARLTGIARGEICAVGDHYNDIPMLDGRYARWAGCPSNAAEAVKETVRASGGYVASGACSAGVVEIVERFRQKAGAI
jgi:HAD superfamily hydrolase (TIGR01484 family)